MSKDGPDSDQERRLSRGSTPLSPNHPPGAETTGPGKEGMQELHSFPETGKQGRGAPWHQSCTPQAKKKTPT